MRLFRFAGILLFAIIAVTMLVPNPSPCQSGKEIEELTGQIDQLKKQGRYYEAIPLAAKFLAINEERFGPDHPNVSRALNNLGNFYRITGRYAEAEPIIKRSLAIQEAAPFGPERPSVAGTLVLLAMVYNNTGRYAEAEALLKRSLDILERARTPIPPERKAFSLALLAESYHLAGRNDEAEPIMKRSLDIWGKSQSIVENTAFSLIILARIYNNMGRYAEAEPLVKRSLEICEKTLGNDSPNVALALANLARIYNNTGRNAEAEPLFRRSLEIREKVFGENHTSVAISLNSMGFHYGITGKHNEANVFFRRSVDIRDSIRESIFTLLTEKQKLSYMKSQERGIYGYMSHTLNFSGNDQAAVTDTFNAWLRWKGSVIEAQGRYMDALTVSGDPKVQEKFKELTAVRRQIASLQLSGSGNMDPDEYKKKIAELEKTKGVLETELTVMSRDFMLRNKARTADVRAVSSMLPGDAAYLDYARITPFDFKAKRWGKPRYLLFVFIPGSTPRVRLMDMGTSERADSHINAYLREMNRAKTEGALPDEKKLRKEASILYDILIKPAEPFLKGRKHILVSPDGNLNLMPFEVLTAPSGTYLIEDYLVSYVGAGRDMMKFTPQSLKGGVSLIIADPDYDLGQKGLEQSRNAEGLRTARIRGHVSRSAKGMRFDRLPDTVEEANTIEKILEDRFAQKVSNRQDKKALEDILFGTPSPKVLHLATHGYFLSVEETRQPEKIQEGLSLDSDPLQDLPAAVENPMLRSGIVLAGANTSLEEGRDDGMVTAEKVLGLKLKGTDIVVLSACQTGIGDIQSGEGVFGLKRAFILSGAKTLVMSLWSVPSKETVELMTSFYTLLSEGKTKAEALRQAKLTLMKKNPNPFFWGAFVMTGSPQ